MKMTKFLSSTMIATLVLGAAAGAVSAAENVNGGDHTSTAKVEVKEGQAGGGGTSVDPEDPEKPVVPGPGEWEDNEDKGPLVIEGASTLKFGTIETGTNNINKFAAPTSIQDKDENGAATGEARLVGNYVQWSDIRSAENYGYTLSVKMTQQFVKDGVAGGAELKGSTITFSNPMMNSAADFANWGTLNAAEFTLTEEDADAHTFVTADKATEKGKGQYTVEFGQSTDWDATTHPSGNAGVADTADKSVKLFVPKATASTMATGNYEATLTWSLVAAQ